jgi:predicted Zn-dependent protease
MMAIIVSQSDEGDPMKNLFLRLLLHVLAAFVFTGLAQEQETYLSDQASNPETTGGVARLLHYLPQDIPINVYIPEAEGLNTAQARETVIRAFEAWQDAVPELIEFTITAFPSENAIAVSWQTLEAGKIGSYRYAYSVLPDGQYRFRATDIFLDPSLDSDTLYRYALVQVGHALGLLGRSPFEGDAMSQSPSGVISERDKATLRALYAVPSGTPLF